MSPWGASSENGQHGHSGEYHSSHRNGDANGAEDDGAPPPSEYTRLLPSRIDTDTHQHQYLTPDDPAVSPYNLWSVRVLRFFTIVLAVITLAWWTIALVSFFATPPGLHAPGSGFFTFSYASLALSEVLLTLSFFGVPARATRVLAWVIAAVLLANVITIASVSGLRYEESWSGLATAIWALLMALWTAGCDGAVRWGKAEEEIRLTGRPETRRTAGEWLAVMMSSVGHAVVTLAALLMTVNLFLRISDVALEPPGQLFPVDRDKYRIHLFCKGNASANATPEDGTRQPTVLLEGGSLPVEHGLWQLADDALANGTIARYCFADRPGFGWSDTAPSPFSAGFAADALSEALARAGETGPWVLASTGIGSAYSRVFSARHGHDVVGLLLVDPLHEDLLYRIGNPSVGFDRWFWGIMSPLGLARIPGALFQGEDSRDRVVGIAARGSGKYILAKLQESLVAETLTRREVERSRAMQARDIPFALVSSGDKMDADSGWKKGQENMRDMTDELVAWDIVKGVPRRRNIWDDEKGRRVVLQRLGELVR
jgi:pimeloyl-ACP methyl ester carboxylesterase